MQVLQTGELTSISMGLIRPPPGDNDDLSTLRSGSSPLDSVALAGAKGFGTQFVLGIVVNGAYDAAKAWYNNPATWQTGAGPGFPANTDPYSLNAVNGSDSQSDNYKG